MKVIIIGAGPAGLSCGYRLKKENKAIEVEIYEASPFVGGMARSFELWRQRVDLGPHRFFSKQREVNEFFNELVGDDFTLVNRQTRIYYRKRFFDYPLRLGNVLINLPLKVILQILWHYFFQVIRPIKDPKTFEDWVTNRFGRKLFEIFFKHYTEKLWGIKCSHIDADWAAQRIKKLTLMQAVFSAIFGNRKNRHNTLVDQFVYPKNGNGVLYERAADFISQNGGRVVTNSKVKKVLLNKARTKVLGVELTDGTVVNATHVISTMPITTLIKSFDDVPDSVAKAADSLYFRNTILVYHEFDKKDLFTDNWLYIHSPEVQHGRITNFRNWCDTLTKGKATTILCMEFWCFDKDKIWTDDDQRIIDIAKKEIRQIQLLPADAKILNSKVIRVPKCYPVYETGYQKHMNVLVEYFRLIDGLHLIGRYGAFKYNNQDHSILMGLLAAEKIIDNSSVDLWKINTDTEYQEDGKIKDVLVQ